MRSRTRCDTYHRFSRVANDDEVAKQRVPERRMGQDVDMHVSKTVQSTPRLLRPCFRPAESTVIFSEHIICNVDIRVNFASPNIPRPTQEQRESQQQQGRRTRFEEQSDSNRAKMKRANLG